MPPFLAQHDTTVHLESPEVFSIGLRNFDGQKKKYPHPEISDRDKRKCLCLLDIYTNIGYNTCVIKSFADRETEKVYRQVFSKKLPQSIQRVALRKLIMIDNAGCLEDLRIPPANRLEALHGSREGQYSIRINDQYRICFTVDNNNFFNVEIVDYH